MAKGNTMYIVFIYKEGSEDKPIYMTRMGTNNSVSSRKFHNRIKKDYFEQNNLKIKISEEVEGD